MLWNAVAPRSGGTVAVGTAGFGVSQFPTVKSGDFDDDGDVDFIYSSTGTFVARLTMSDAEYGDFDGDGRGDLLVARQLPPAQLDGELALIRGRATADLPLISLDASGAGSYAIDVPLVLVGTTHWYQFLYRDALHPDGTGIGMSDGLQVRFMN